MVGRVGFALLAALALAGCGEGAKKEDMIDAPTVSGSVGDSAKARGVSDEEIARQRAMDPGASKGQK